MLPLLAAAGGLQAIGGIVNFANYLATAQEQKRRADKLEGSIAGMQKDPLSKYYQRSLTEAEGAASRGIAGIDTYRQSQDADFANQVRAIQLTSPSGNTTVNAISRALGAKNDQTQQLNVQDANARLSNERYAGQVEGQVGAVDQSLQQQLNLRKERTQQMVEALRNASTQNKQSGISGITSSITGGITGVTRGLLAKGDTGDTATPSTATGSQEDNIPYTDPGGASIQTATSAMQSQLPTLIQQLMSTQGLSVADATKQAKKMLGLG